MKKTLIALAALMITAVTYGQGQVTFNNRVGTDVNAPISRPDGTGAGAGFTAQLLLVNGTSTTPLTPTTDFRTSSPAAAFFVNDPGVPINVPGTNPGDSVKLRLIAFNNGSPTAATVLGQSADFTVTLGGGTLPPANLGVNGNGLQGFQMHAVPEPTTIALGILGLGALMIRRRK
jgi:hypothetical protein